MQTTGHFLTCNKIQNTVQTHRKETDLKEIANCSKPGVLHEGIF